MRAWNYFLISLVTIWLHIQINDNKSIIIPTDERFSQAS